MTIHKEHPREENVTEYPESMRGGSWDRAHYAGTPDEARKQAETLAATVGGTLRPDRPSWAASRPQVWYDGWRHAWRVLRFDGLCVVCERRTYTFDDGENDPRGVLGDRAGQHVTHEDVDELPEGEYVAACFACMNEEPSYRRALDLARFYVRRREARATVPATRDD